MKKRVAILQSSYIPWKGYFDIIRAVDEFVLYDDAQYTRRDWRNRNKIKTPNGPLWLTIPVETKGKYLQKINETVVSDPSWAEQHWKSICQNYRKAPHFAEYEKMFEALYESLASERSLSQINFRAMKTICPLLSIPTKITWSSDYRLAEGKTEKLLEICVQAEASEYLSGPSAQGYLEEQKFLDAKIAVSWANYSGYPEYSQLFPPFTHEVSVLDLLFNQGPEAPRFMKSL
ncbi:MAG: WbqC family protein [Bdellovibrionota bacterium]